MAKKRLSKGRITAIVLAVVAVLLAGGLAFAANFLFDFALNPHASYTMKDMTDAGEVSGLDKPQNNDEAYAREAKAWFAANKVQVERTGEDGTPLSGWKFEQSDTVGGPSHEYAVVLHGYTGQPSDMAKYAYHFYQRGMNVLTPAARAHEKSGGDYIGMGWPERRDVVGWIKDIVAADPQARILVFGVSMGGATAMMVSGEEDLPENVSCIIEECGHSSVWDEFAMQLDNVFRLPSFPLLDAANVVANIRAGYDFHQASAVEQLKHAKVPMLFIHGDKDTFVPYEMLDTVYGACASPIKEKLVVKGAPHGGSCSTDPELYWSTVDTFLDKNF